MRAYREQMGNDIGIKAGELLRDRYVRELDGFQLDPEAVVENIMDRPGYEGYRNRHNEFFSTRTDHWWRRFERSESDNPLGFSRIQHQTLNCYSFNFGRFLKIMFHA